MTIKQQGGVFGRNPTFNDVEVEGTLTATGTVSVPADSISGNAINGGTATLDGLTVDTTTFHVDSSNNRIGVGTTSPIAVVDVDMGVGGARRLLANYDDSIVSLKSSNASANPETLRLIGGNIRFNTGGSGSGSEIARVTDNGITFNGDTAAANALDDYEEGTWTPVASTNNGVSGTWSVSHASYTKIGRVVTLVVRFTGTGIGFSSTTGYYGFSGIPFSVVDSEASAGSWTVTSVSAGASGASFVTDSGSRLWLLSPSNTSTGGAISASCTYETDS
jgi:hypothetical protein